jgi:hypothetical protein
VYSFRRPLLFQQDLDVSFTQRSELVDETDPGEEASFLLCAMNVFEVLNTMLCLRWR